MDYNINMGTGDTNLSMVRGDTLSFGIELEGLDQDLDSAYFTCKVSNDDTTPLFQKSLGYGITKVSQGEYRVRVAPEDTEDLDAGKYYYDLEISVNGDVFTIMNGFLEMSKDTTLPENRGESPTFTISITENGTYDVSTYTTAEVNVPNPSTGTLNITANDTYDVSSYASANVNVPSGITPTGTKQVSITQNGTTTEDVTNYASAQITANVPNSYSAGDEGKVVSSGALVSQTSKNISSNGTVDTTANNQVVVNVPNSYVAGDEGKVVSNGALVSQTSDTVTANDTYDTTLINSLTVNVSGGASSENAILDGTLSGAYENSIVTKLRNFALNGLTSLTSVSFPNVTEIGNNVMQGCTEVTSISFPKLTKTGTYAFAGMTKLVSAVFPLFNAGLGTFVFSGDSLLKTVDLGPSCSSLGGQAFAGCSVLDTVILRRSSVVSCSVNTFNNTPFASGGTGGTVYVPNDLISSYQSASNWSTLYNAGTVTFAKIEGSIYENAYADGTSIS